SSTYTFSAPDIHSDTYHYLFPYTSLFRSAFTSTAGTLRVNSVTAATVANQSTCSGTDATFTVVPTSSGSASLSYQWKRSTNGGTTFSNISGATSSTYTVTAPDNSSDNYQYECIVTSVACAAFTSTAWTLRVNSVTAATVASQSTCSGTDATFTVMPTSSGSASLSYQWKRSTDNGSTFTNISGATSSTYTVTAPDNTSDNYQYECVVT